MIGKTTINIFSIIKALSILLLASPMLAVAGTDEPYACEKVSTAQTRLDRANQYFNASEAESEMMKVKLKEDVVTATDNLEAATRSCESARKLIKETHDECDKRNNQLTGDGAKAMYKWEADGEYGTCVSLAKTPTATDDGDCGNAAQFEGGLRGENCKKAVTTIANVEARNNAITQTTTLATSTFAQTTAAQSTGQQGEAQASQEKIMKSLAAAKIVSSASQLAGAVQLKSASKNAQEASDKMNSAYSGIRNDCAADPGYADHEEDCFYAKAGNYGISASSMEYSNYERLKSGATQSQDQADRANAAYKTSAISGLADAVVGLQAWKAAKAAGKNTTALNTLPPPSFILNGSQGSSTQPGVGGVSAGNTPTDYGSGGDQGALLGNVGGNGVPDGLVTGQTFGTPGYTPAKSTVSSGGGGGGGGGGTGGRGGGGGKDPKKGKNLGPTGVGEYSLAGGGLQNPKVDNNKKEDGNNAFADALSKLFPPDQDGKPVVDNNRIPASDQRAAANSNEGESEAFAAELSIFQQISARIRQLTNAGRI